MKIMPRRCGSTRGGLAGAGDGHWRATGLDPEGLDLACGDRTARLTFPRRIEEPAGLRTVLVELAGRARAPAGGRS